MQLLDGKYQVPVATPNYVATVKGEGTELLWVKVFVVLWMWMTTDKVTDIYGAVGAIAED